jgi:lipopolysaccharide transport system ATP-binding protein
MFNFFMGAWRYRQFISSSIQSEFKNRFIHSRLANLGVGSYSVTIAAHEGRAHGKSNYQWRDLALIFNVTNSSHADFVGCNWLEPQISIEKP